MYVVEPTDTTPGVIYLATQPDMYHAKLSYLGKAIKNLAAWCRERHIKSVALPKIGAGLGRLNWESQVRPLFLEYLTESECLFVVYEDYVTARDA